MFTCKFCLNIILITLLRNDEYKSYDKRKRSLKIKDFPSSKSVSESRSCVNSESVEPELREALSFPFHKAR